MPIFAEIGKMKKITQIIFVFILLFTVCFQFTISQAGSSSSNIVQLRISGAIGPASADYFIRSLENITEQTELVILQLDTPGGLDSSMRDIVKAIINSSIPIVSFVAPSGARAASAGTYILYASHIAAMAPGTNLGAATPVKIGGISPPKLPKPGDDKKPEGGLEQDAMKQKMINDAAAYIRGLAEMHDRNKDWAELAVRKAASLSAKEALQKNVINILANDVNDLVKQLEGRIITIHNTQRTLNTTGKTVIKVDPDWRSRLLSVITNPNVAYILMLVGIYGLIFEFSNPGAILPGTVGAISLVLALYAFQLLPINYAGLALILLGLALMVAEAFEPSFGVLGIGGIIAFVFGSIILMDTKAPGFGIDIAVIIGFTLISATLLFFIIGMALKARRRPVVSGLEELIGSEAIVVNDFDELGSVTVHSETWKAHTKSSVHKGESVKVTDVNGLTLEVEPIQGKT